MPYPYFMAYVWDIFFPIRGPQWGLSKLFSSKKARKPKTLKVTEVTQKGPPKVTQKWLKNDSEIARPWTWKPEAPGLHKLPPLLLPSKFPPKPPKNLPPLLWECTGVHSIVESFWGQDGGVFGEWGWQLMKTWGFQARGFASPE